MPSNCKTISCELLVVRLRRKVKRRRYADVNGDWKPVFGIGMVLGVERCIVFSILLTRKLLLITNAQPPFSDLVKRVWFKSEDL